MENRLHKDMNGDTRHPTQKGGNADYHQAVVFHQRGRMDLALHFYRQALGAAPYDARIHHDMGVLHYQTGNYSQAYLCFEAAARHDPAMAQAHYNSGNVLCRIGQHRRALVCYQQAVRLKPDFADAHFNLANTCKFLDDISCAEKHYRKALFYDPGHKEALNNLGILKLQQADYDAAITFFNQVLGIAPCYTEALYNLSLAYKRKGSVQDAIAGLKKILGQSAGHGKSIALLVSLLQQTCAWQELADTVDMLLADTRKQLEAGRCSAESPFLCFTLDDDPERCLQVARAWSREVETKYPPCDSPFEHSPAKFARKSIITIGYLSEQFRDAATAHLVAGLFGCHSRNRFKINAYALCAADNSRYQNRIRKGVDRFVELRCMDAHEAAKQIYADGVNILVDLIGWMQGNRIAITALRPAPVQVNYLGFPGTMGASFIDYIIADDVVIPPGQERFYSEAVVRLPHCYQATDPYPDVDTRAMDRHFFDLPSNAFVFCCFCTDYKIEKKLFAVWLSILKAVPGSVLWLLLRCQSAKDNLCNAATQAGVDAGRLVFAAPLEKSRHLARLKLADLALDTLTVNGHTTTTDALWSGLPVITLQGGHFASRVAASILKAAGLDDLVCRSLAEYEQKAVSFATDGQLLKSLKTRLERNRKTYPLFDVERFSRGLETAYSTMWALYCQGKTPRGFHVFENG